MRRPPVPELEQQLAALGNAVDWPPTPDLTGVVHLPALRGGGGERRWGGAFAAAPKWVLAAAAILIALAALVAYPPSRDAIANWVNVHTSFRQVPHLATPTPQPPGPLGERLGLGGRSTLPEAQKQLTWHIAIPSTLGQPDELYLQPAPDAPAQGEVTLVYSARHDIPVAAQTDVSVLVTEARGAVDQNFFGKMLGPNTTLATVTVVDHHGYWVSRP